MRLYGYLAVGSLLMLGAMLAANRNTRVPWYKLCAASVLLTLSGLAGAMLMAFIESGNWGGRSFFGALFLAPVLMVPVALALRIPWRDMLDLCAPAECVMLALLKVQCTIDGCCYGMLLRIDMTGRPIRFPSQIVECACALVLMLVLVVMMRKNWGRGRIYAWYMLLYGVSRFALNLLRETTPFIWILPAGNFWALISSVIGLAIILAGARKMPVREEKGRPA